MDAIQTLKQDVQAGRIGADRLVDLVVSLQRQVQGAHLQLLTAQQQLQAAQQRIEELEKKRGGATAKVEEPFSLRAEEKRQEARGKKKRQPKQPKRRGRIPSKDKVAQAERTEAVFPEGVAPDACYLSHVRPVWRLEGRRAVLVAYPIYRGPNGPYGKIPGVLGRSEFGLEIATEIAYLVYVMGLSFDKACVLLNSFRICG
jgi:transposase